MINLEWLRSFRTVYKTKSLSAASELLNISQPTVSQHIKSLETYLNQELFTRKSKGVIETDEGRILNTLVSGTIEELEEIEGQISHKYSEIKTIGTIGISPSLYKTVLCNRMTALGNRIHVKFGKKDELIKDVELGILNYAVVPEEVNTFDTICYPVEDQDLVLVSTPDVELNNLKSLIKQTPAKAQKLLANHNWYAHDAASGYIKIFWLNIFAKKRPNIIPNYIVPNEYEILTLMTSGTNGLSVALRSVAQPFVNEGSLKILPHNKIPFRKLCLVANKKKAPKQMTEKILGLIKA
ncbi:MAG: LysR family transcriptional regulator [Schleiferiaceae bacterium]|jgi:DNA-binding transcriptional LysR family regulator|nr:LysR family transcriptional regulator [Schleiferiaceae bacterium]